MAMDSRKRQKKLERRKAKEKAKKKALVRQDPRNVAVRIERAAVAPILHCCTTDVLWDQGISSVLMSRELKSGSSASRNSSPRARRASIMSLDTFAAALVMLPHPGGDTGPAGVDVKRAGNAPCVQFGRTGKGQD